MILHAKHKESYIRKHVYLPKFCQGCGAFLLNEDAYLYRHVILPEDLRHDPSSIMREWYCVYCGQKRIKIERNRLDSVMKTELEDSTHGF